MSQILKCPNMRVVLSYWEALIEGSELRYESLLYLSSNGSYCTNPILQELATPWQICSCCIKNFRPNMVMVMVMGSIGESDPKVGAWRPPLNFELIMMCS